MTKPSGLDHVPVSNSGGMKRISDSLGNTPGPTQRLYYIVRGLSSRETQADSTGRQLEQPHYTETTPDKEIKSTHSLMHSIDVGSEHIPYYKNGSGPILLFLHGFGAELKYVKALLDKLSETHTVIAPEIFSLNTIKNPPITIAECAELTNIFCQKLGITPEVIIGHSLGSGIALDYTKDHPGEQKLVFLSPLFPVDYGMTEFAARAAYRHLRDMTGMYGGLDGVRFALKHLFSFPKILFRNIPATYHLAKDITRFQLSSYSLPNRISLISGKDDEYFDLQAYLSTLEQKPNISSKLLVGCNHDWPLFYGELAAKEILDSLGINKD